MQPAIIPAGEPNNPANLAAGDTADALDNSSGFPFELIEPAPGLLDPLTAEVHAVIRTHGAALDDPNEQLSTFSGDCNPECVNVQATLHTPETLSARNE